MRKQYSGKEIKALLETLPESLRIFSKKDKIERIDDQLRLHDNPFLIFFEDRLIPHLKFLQKDPRCYPCLSVDKGAIPFLIKGADLMRPGIRTIEPCRKDETVIIIDETYGKAVAVGITLCDADEMQVMAKGKAARIVHYVGDAYWGA